MKRFLAKFPKGISDPMLEVFHEWAVSRMKPLAYRDVGDRREYWVEDDAPLREGNGLYEPPLRELFPQACLFAMPPAPLPEVPAVGGKPEKLRISGDGYSFITDDDPSEMDRWTQDMFATLGGGKPDFQMAPHAATLGWLDRIAFPDGRLVVNAIGPTANLKEDVKPDFVGYRVKDGVAVRDDSAVDAAMAFAMPSGRPLGEILSEFRPLRNSMFPEMWRGEERNSMQYWLPVAEKYADTPKTRLIPLPMDPSDLLDGKKPKAWNEFVELVRKNIREYPVFLRTDQTSGKHCMDSTSFLERPEDLAGHLANLVNDAAIKDRQTTAIAVREWIGGEPAWLSEDFGNMPVKREFRIFVEHGAVTHVQPYWPPEAFAHNDEPDGWEEMLRAISTISKSELETLMKVSVDVANELGGNWSVDWLASPDGWKLIDMAEAEKSYRWEPDFEIIEEKTEPRP